MSDKPKLHLAIVKQMLALAVSGFSFVTALAWNNVIQEAVNNYIRPYLPAGSGLLSLFIYAAIVTTLAIVVTYQLTSLAEKIEKQ